ncbi:16S rRNA (guanine527-N7)-methyltransferase [Albidovulum inexpectatum]|uniref:Ribosomal RNA small subunit methyltransferase G n=1 Tax=Albidovulum inexpectatum TaxID=196587 RepID=A0A2S5JMC0_9RHOB|nr:16S rRNA (guanine(527)-N(7))-methyltransferase RsmG [Albidovulum inexpectatum]PPB82656.1 16S rRNA (guanine527-N7)-methyltransferase [Albidovulum inexpectatum]
MTAIHCQIRGRDVSRETFERLRRYEDLLRKWTSRINLIGRSTITEIQERHIRDSIQVFDSVPDATGNWVDLGSGAGLPGMIVAILAVDERPDLKVTLVEADLRKSAFLATVARELGLDLRIEAQRIENIAPLGADVLSARALAPLPKLLEFAQRHMAPDGVAVFPKGARWQEELRQALEKWRFSYQNQPSVTEPDATILKIGGISRV